jgi:hypothetical protein
MAGTGPACRDRPRWGVTGQPQIRLADRPMIASIGWMVFRVRRFRECDRAHRPRMSGSSLRRMHSHKRQRADRGRPGRDRYRQVPTGPPLPCPSGRSVNAWIRGAHPRVPRLAPGKDRARAGGTARLRPQPACQGPPPRRGRAARRHQRGVLRAPRARQRPRRLRGRARRHRPRPAARRSRPHAPVRPRACRQHGERPACAGWCWRQATTRRASTRRTTPANRTCRRTRLHARTRTTAGARPRARRSRAVRGPVRDGRDLPAHRQLQRAAVGREGARDLAVARRRRSAGRSVPPRAATGLPHRLGSPAPPAAGGPSRKARSWATSPPTTPRHGRARSTTGTPGTRPAPSWAAATARPRSASGCSGAPLALPRAGTAVLTVTWNRQSAAVIQRVC